MESPDQRLIKLIRSLPPQEAQNRLMRVTDRELAISILYMEKPEQKLVLQRLGASKSRRVRQELDYVSHLRLRYPQYRDVIEQVIERISGRSDGSIRSYIRPRRE